MKESEAMFLIKRLSFERDQAMGKVAELVNALYVQGQIGCGIAFDAGAEIVRLERLVSVRGALTEAGVL